MRNDLGGIIFVTPFEGGDDGARGGGAWWPYKWFGGNSRKALAYIIFFLITLEAKLPQLATSFPSDKDRESINAEAIASPIFWSFLRAPALTDI
ncbi:hypothetical protein CEXT_422451 [Caerostris extrusa]|uniref:Uncharacterized protein n=1 Tax=Caerostris extrusa TaxID=172846 RepID=A0AAV4NHV5_CAEEX|nr:hypothetical protein CEXT_422451 [Caerostris extrusa]